MVKTALYFRWPSLGVYEKRDDKKGDVGLFVNLDQPLEIDVA